jgi:hypothetical protein
MLNQIRIFSLELRSCEMAVCMQYDKWMLTGIFLSAVKEARNRSR